MLKTQWCTAVDGKNCEFEPKQRHPLNEGVKYLGLALDVGFGSNGHDGPETRLPVFSEQRTSSVAVGMSQTCQRQT
jgi:hypothetical protein